ncbi:MAG TPA: hypothetical protein VJ806_13155 [Luteimonas sp.]|nr:hypothetical protein [Luteimonas sp.]
MVVVHKSENKLETVAMRFVPAVEADIKSFADRITAGFSLSNVATAMLSFRLSSGLDALASG